MLTRSYITILMQQVDVTKAYDLLAMFKDSRKPGTRSIFLRRWTYGCPFRGSDQSMYLVGYWK